jgi:Sec-independent protein translocase protein TatA
MTTVLVALVCVALLGTRLPDLGRYLRKGVAEFRRGMEEYREEIDDVTAARVRRVLARALEFRVLLTVAVCLLGRGP